MSRSQKIHDGVVFVKIFAKSLEDACPTPTSWIKPWYRRFPRFKSNILDSGNSIKKVGKFAADTNQIGEMRMKILS